MGPAQPAFIDRVQAIEQEEAVQATKGPKRPKIPITDEDRARALAPAGLFLHLPCKMGNTCTFTDEFDPE
jgi:hypothetical protein